MNIKKRKMFQPKSAAEAAEKVREAIARNPSPDVTLEVVDEGIRRRPEGWVVPVRPVRWPRYFYMYAGMLAEVEIDMRGMHDINVHLTTAQPIEDEEPATIAAA